MQFNGNSEQNVELWGNIIYNEFWTQPHSIFSTQIKPALLLRLLQD